MRPSIGTMNKGVIKQRITMVEAVVIASTKNQAMSLGSEESIVSKSLEKRFRILWR